MKFEVVLDELDLFAQTFWQEWKGAKLFAFHGAMGAGKTTMIIALCKALGVQDAVSSPTFSIINEYADGNGQPVFHMDLYRLNDPEEVAQTGVEDAIASGYTCMIEWPEKAPHLFDDATVHVHISIMENGMRLAEIKDSGF